MAGVLAPMGVEKTLTRADVNSLLHSHQYVSPVFSSSGGSSSKSYGEAASAPAELEGTVRDLLAGTLHPSDLPAMRCVVWDGALCSLDNRRLWVLKEFARRSGQQVQIDVVVEDRRNPLLQAELHRKLASCQLDAPVQTAQLRQVNSDAGARGIVLQYEATASLMRVVLPWSCAELLANPHMFSNKVEDLPLQYAPGAPGVMSYASKALWLTMEEIRAQLQQALERSSTLTWSEVCIDERAMGSDRTSGGGIVTIQVADATGQPGGRDATARDGTATRKGPTGCKPTDIVILSSKPAHQPEQWARPDTVHSLGLVQQLVIDDEQNIAAKVAVFAHTGSSMWERLGLASGSTPSAQKTWYMTMLGSTATTGRIWDALQEALLAAKKNTPSILSRILLAVLCPNPGSTPPPALSPLQLQVARHCEVQGLNPSQTQAVCSIVSCAEAADHAVGIPRVNRCVQLVQGPPGTGKTATLVQAVHILASQGKSVLVCAPTNVAVQEVAARYLQLLNSASSSSSSSRYWQMGTVRHTGPADVALLANEDVVVEGSEVQAIWVTARAKRLAAALGLTGIAHQAARLGELSKSSPNRAYQEYVRQLCEQAVRKDKVAWYRDAVAGVCQQLLDSLQTLVADLPSSMLSEATRLACLELCTQELPSLQHDIRTASAAAVKALIDYLDASVSTYITGDVPWLCAPLLRALTDAAAAARHVSSRLPKLPASVRTKPGQELYHLELQCLAAAHVVFCTVSTSGRRVLAKARQAADRTESTGVPQLASQGQEAEGPGFDVCIIDEAAQLIEAETAITLQAFPRLPCLMLVGDHKQLPATVMSQHAQKHNYQRSLFERLEACHVPVHMLDMQYRMHPDISLHPRHAFYQGRLQNGQNVLSTSRAAHLHGLTVFQELGAYHVIDISRGHEERCEVTASKRNKFEAYTVCHLVKRLAKEFKEQARGTQLSVGIISPYAAQVTLIQEVMGDWMLSSTRNYGVSVEIKSVDGFQGREKDVILITTVRSNSKGRVGFLQDQRRLNVAVTRGKHAVWVFTNAKTLQADEGWAELLENARGRGVLTGSDALVSVTAAFKCLEVQLKRQANLKDPTCDLFRGMTWEVEFSKEFAKDIQQVPESSRARVVDVMLLLAEGQRPPQYPEGSIVFNQTTAAYRSLIHVQRVEGMKLIWTVDVDRAECRQIIRVWRIVQDADVLRTVRRLEAALAVYTPDAITRCKTLKWKGRCAIPVVWAQDPGFTWTRCAGGQQGSGGEVVLEQAVVSESLLLMKFFPLDSGSARLLLSSVGANMDQMFKLNEEETRILHHDRSSFVQGRSGTGKTTVIVAMLLMREFAADIHLLGSDPAVYDAPPLGPLGPLGAGSSSNSRTLQQVEQGTRVRQLLVTLSPKLCAAMRADIARKMQTQEQIKALSTITGVSTDESVAQSMNVALADQLLDEEAVARMMHGLPAAMARVPDCQCPLVLPLKHVLLMLDESMPTSFAGSYAWGGQPVDDVEETPSSSPAFTRSEVSYEVFELYYWPTFDMKKRQGMGAAMVWTQIQSYIKGSREAAWSAKGRLSKEEYQALAHTRSGSYLTTDQRDIIYSLFTQYERLKGQRYEWDMCDLTCHLHQQLRQYGFPTGAQFHCLYIDEVQDLTPAQLSLFAFLCKRKLDGYVFAGDTAQTIAKGVDFRFEDIRALYYLDYLGHGSAGGSSGGGSSGSVMSDMFQLVKNYRTHAGIVKLSSTIVQAIMHFFPLSVDKLQPESSMIHGPEPVMVLGDDPLEVLLKGSQGQEGMLAGSAGCDFGAEQAILVRDEDYKEKLKQQLGPDAARNLLILTAHECKGLEFQVVLIHGFFSSSPLEGAWRLMYGYMQELGLMTKAELQQEKWHSPAFSPQKHQLLCSELKLCYVLCTRAKHCVLFYEPDPEKADPMVEFWSRLNVIRCKRMDSEVRNMLVHKSTPEEWQKRARDLFNSGFYEHARLCSLRAGDAQLADRCEAEGLRQDAQRLRVPADRMAKFAAAAEAFLRLELREQAANCHVEAGQHQRAAVLFEQLRMYPRAAAQYEACNPPVWAMAATCWSRAGKLDTALQCCATGLGITGKTRNKGSSGHYVDTTLIDTGLTLVAAHLTDSPPYPYLDELRTEFLEAALVKVAETLSAAKAVKTSAAVKAASSLSVALSRYLVHLGDEDMQVELLERFELKEGLLNAHIKAGNYNKAAMLCEELGRADEALQHHTAAGNHAEVLATRLHLLRVACMWSGNNSQGWPLVVAAGSEASSQVKFIKQILGTAWAARHKAQVQQLCTSSTAPGKGAGQQTSLSCDNKLVLEAEVLFALVDAASSSSLENQLHNVRRLAGLKHVVAKHLPGSCSELMLSVGLWHALTALCRAVGNHLQRTLKVQASRSDAQNWKDQTEAAPASAQDLSKVVLEAAALFAEHWQELAGQLSEVVRAMSSVASKSATSTASETALVRSCMEYMACTPHPSYPGCVLLETANPAWLPPHMKGKSGKLTMAEYGMLARSFFRDELCDAAFQVTQLVEGAGTALSKPMSGGALDLPGLIKTTQLQLDASDANTVAPATELLGVKQHPLYVRASLLLACQRACQALAQSLEGLSRGATRHDGTACDWISSAGRILKRLVELCLTHISSATDRPVLQLPEVLSSSSVQAVLTKYMLEECSWSFNGREPLDFWYRYPQISLEDFGRLLLIQGVLPDNLPMNMPRWPSWFRLNGRGDQMSPWQLLAAAMLYACYMRKYLKAAAVRSRFELSKVHQDLESARVNAENATSSGLDACYTSLETPSPDASGRWYNFRMSPMTLLAMMERLCTVGMAQIKGLVDCTLPQSLVIRYLTAPGPAHQLTALVKLRGTSQKGQGALRASLCHISRVLEYLLRDNVKLSKLFSQAGEGYETEELVQQWRRRALVLMFALALNVPASRLTFGSNEQFSPVNALKSVLEFGSQIMGRSMTMRLKVEFTKLASATSLFGSDLRRVFPLVLEALGDQPVVLQLYPSDTRYPPGTQQIVVVHPDPAMSQLPDSYAYQFSLAGLLTSAHTAAAQAGATGTAPTAQFGELQAQEEQEQEEEEVEQDYAALSAEAQAAEAAHLKQLQDCLRRRRIVQGLRMWKQYTTRSLSPAQALYREACKAFAARSVLPGVVQLSRSGTQGQLGLGAVKGCVYLQIYLETVCRLQALVAHLEDLLPRADRLLVDQLKAVGAFGRGSRHVDMAEVRSQKAPIQARLQKVRAVKRLLTSVHPFLNPWNEKHVDLDVTWLRTSVVQTLQQVLDRSQLPDMAAVLKQAAEAQSKPEEEEAA